MRICHLGQFTGVMTGLGIPRIVIGSSNPSWSRRPVIVSGSARDAEGEIVDVRITADW